MCESLSLIEKTYSYCLNPCQHHQPCWGVHCKYCRRFCQQASCHFELIFYLLVFENDPKGAPHTNKIPIVLKITIYESLFLTNLPASDKNPVRSSIYLLTVFWTSLSTFRCPLKFGLFLCFAKIKLKSTEILRVKYLRFNDLQTSMKLKIFEKLTFDFSNADKLTMMIAIRWKVIQNQFC